MRRVGLALVFAGLVLVVGGVLIGWVPVSTDCGSAFSPSIAGDSDAAVRCSVLLSARPSAAWSLMVLGAAVTAAGGVLASGEAGPVRRPAPTKPEPEQRGWADPNY